MTLEEAMKVAEVASECDGGCPSCVKDLSKRLAEAFPEFLWAYLPAGALGNGPGMIVVTRDAAS